MISLLKSSRLPNFWLQSNAILVTPIRNHWLKDYKPGPYPQTEEERIIAAEKYGLPLAEYKPYPDNGQGKGDYPDLPLVAVESHDPFYPWDYPEFKRNFNEPMHAEYDFIREDRYNVDAKFRKSMLYMIIQLVGVLSSTFALYMVSEKVRMFPAVLPKQYPKQGKKHYTFEPLPPPPKKK